MHPELRFGYISEVFPDLGTFRINQQRSFNHFFSGRDCASTVIGTNGSTSLSGTRPSQVYKVRRGQKIVFQVEHDFAISWAPLSKYHSAKKISHGGERARTKIGRKTYVGNPARIFKLTKTLSPKEEDLKIKVFTRKRK